MPKIKHDDDTTSMDSGNICMMHSGIKARVDTLEKNQDKLFTGLNSMKNWVVVGMGAVLLQVLIFAGQVLASFIGKH